MSEIKRITIRDVGKACGVSTATVSRAFKEGTEISDVTRQAILQKAQQMGYSPNPSAQSLRLRRSSNVGLILPEIMNRLYLGLIEKLERVLQKHGFRLLVRFTQTKEPGSEKEALISMCQANVEAIVFIPRKGMDSISKSVLELYGEVCLIQAFHSVYPEYDSVKIDDTKGIHDAMEFLIRNQHRRILFLGTHTRLDAYRAALEEYQIPFDPALTTTSPGTIDTETIYQMILEQNPTAILAIATDAEKVLWTLLKHNISFPGYISFLVYDDVSWVSDFDITAIAHPLDELVDHIIRILLARISKSADTPPIQHVLLSPSLVIRSSVARLTDSQNEPAFPGTIPSRPSDK